MPPRSNAAARAKGRLSATLEVAYDAALVRACPGRLGGGRGGHAAGMASETNDPDQLRTLRELVRDAIEVARSAHSSADAETGAALDRARETLSAALRDLDDFTTRSA